MREDMIDEPGLWYSVPRLILWVAFSVHVNMNAIASFVLSEFFYFYFDVYAMRAP